MSSKKPKRKPPMTVTEFARLGGLAAAAKRTPEQRSQLCSNAVKARWAKYRAAKVQESQQAGMA